MSGIGGSIAQALGSATSYLPVLLVNGDAQQGTAFPVKAGSDVFSGDTSTTDPVVARLALQVTVAGPGMVARTATRSLLDRVPPDVSAAASLTPHDLTPLQGVGGIPDVFGAIDHIAISTGSTSLRAVAGQEGAVLDFIGEEGATDPAEYGLGSELWPFAVDDLGLVMMSERTLVPAVADGVGVLSYVASPRVYVSSFAPDASPDVADSETDLLLDGVRIAASAAVPGSTLALDRLWYGVLQSSLETEHALRDESGQDPGTATLTGVSLSMDQPLSVFGGASGAALPPGAPVAMAQAVSAGVLAVVPGPVAGAQVWWTVDPVTGETRSILDPGLGGIARTEPAAPLRAVTDTVAGKAAGAGSRAARGFPKQGAYNNTGRAWSPYGNGYTENGKYVNLNRPTPPPSRCGSGQEYTMLLGCVSVPGAWALRATVGVAVLVATWYVNGLWKAWLGY